MASSTIENRDLSPFLVHPEGVADNLRCVHCKSLKIIIYQKQHCGCRICPTCFYDAVREGKSCPGNSEDCEGVILTYGDGAAGDVPKDVFPDNAVKRAVLNLEIFCIYKSFGCTEQNSVREIIKHSEDCTHKPHLCDWCNAEVDLTTIADHKANYCVMREMTCPHCFITLTVVDYEFNHFDLENNASTCCDKFSSYKCPLCDSGPFNKQQVSYHMSETCIQREAQCPFIEFGCKFHGRGLIVLEQHLSSEVDSHMYLMKKQMDYLGINYKNLKKTFLQLKKSDSIQTKVWCSIDREEFVLRTLQYHYNQKRSEERNDQNNAVINDLAALANKVDQFQGSVNKSGELFWKLTDFARKQRTPNCYDSETFYSSPDGYRLRVRCYPNGNGRAMGEYLSLYFALVSGENDDMLDWPMNHNVTLEIIRPGTTDGNKKQTYCIGVDHDPFRRPSVERANTAVGNPRFLALSEINNYIKNDNILIRCKVEDKSS